MNLKTRISSVAALAASVALSSTAMAQQVGLPVMDTSNTRDMGNLEATPGLSIGTDMMFYGARATLTAQDDVRCFLDAGMLDTDELGSGLAMQLGALWSIPMLDFCDTALRGSLFFSSGSDLDIMGGTVMGIFSDETLVDNLSFYWGAGATLFQRETPAVKTTELSPALAAGLDYKISDSVHLFLEGDYIDDWFAALGVSIR